jgi:hypothetical protein
MINSYLLAIGVEDYNDKDFDTVTYAKNDVQSIHKAFIELGVKEENAKILIDNSATKSLVLREVSRIAKLATESERIIIYYAGHGLFYNSCNYITAWDSSIDNIEGYSIAVNEILSLLSDSKAKKVILFMDCCHSGLSFSKTRDVASCFRADNLLYEQRDSEYLIGFASCKDNEQSSPLTKYKHGIWTYHLLQALLGKADISLYKEGLLFSSKLQEYLRNKTQIDARMEFKDKRIQTPIKFGKETTDFIVADVRKHLMVEPDNKIVINDIEIIKSKTVKVNTLPGFIKGKHHVPDHYDNYTDNWIKTIGKPLIEETIDSILYKAKIEFKYKLSQNPEVDIADGYGQINALDFNFQMDLSLHNDDPSICLVNENICNIKIREGFTIENIDNSFGDEYSTLVFHLKKAISVTEVIQKIEDFPLETGITVDYQPRDLSRCKISIKSQDYTFELTSNLITYNYEHNVVPSKLINVFQTGYAKFLCLPKINTLEIE